MIGRYNPHLIQKRIFPLFDSLQSEISLKDDVISQAEKIWTGTLSWNNPFRTKYSVAPEIMSEYGIDTVRIAEITSSDHPPDEILLESSYRWLSWIHSQTIPNPNSPEPNWNPDPWIIAAFTARDHLLRRRRLYVSLSVIKKAWKLSPVDSRTHLSGKALAFVLLLPFAPCIARTVLSEITGNFPSLSLERLCESFYPRQAVRIGFQRGGWRWEVVDAPAFNKDPREFLGKLPWIKKVVEGREWNVREEKDGWLICLNLPNRK